VAKTSEIHRCGGVQLGAVVDPTTKGNGDSPTRDVLFAEKFASPKGAGVIPELDLSPPGVNPSPARRGNSPQMARWA
jgi:hypothetical protein